MKGKVLGAIAGLGVLGLGVGVIMSRQQAATPHVVAADAPPSVGVAIVQRMNMASTYRVAAEFHPFQEIDVYAKEAGYVKSINVDYGSRVKRGELLATLEIPEMDDELAQVTAAAEAAKQEVVQAQEELSRAKSAFQAAHLSYTRLQSVIKMRPDLVAQQDVDNAFASDQEAAARVSADKAALAASQSHLAGAQADENKVRTLIDYSRITAPFSGVITKRYADAGAMLQAGVASHVQAMPLVRLAQNNLLRLVIPVPEADVPRIRLGDAVQVEVPALNRTFTGKIARFSDQLDLATRTMHTEVDVPNPGLVIVPGMYAWANLKLKSVTGALAVPVAAVTRNGNHASVMVVDQNHRVEQKTVELGLQTPNQVQVVAGLAAGTRVVVSSSAALHAGEVVSPRPMKPEQYLQKSSS